MTSRAMKSLIQKTYHHRQISQHDEVSEPITRVAKSNLTRRPDPEATLRFWTFKSARKSGSKQRMTDETPRRTLPISDSLHSRLSYLMIGALQVAGCDTHHGDHALSRPIFLSIRKSTPAHIEYVERCTQRARLLLNHQSEKLMSVIPKSRMPAISQATTPRVLPFRITPYPKSIKYRMGEM